MRFAVVGAGFSGAVISRELAELGHEMIVFDSRRHVAGNCHTERDPDTGVMVHQYGPHIFHTDNERVWEYINRYGDLMPYRHQVRTTVGGKVYLMPINLLTINQLYGTSMSPKEAKEFIAKEADQTIDEPENFEEQALKFVGRPLYEAFLRGYTVKQWGLDPTKLPASILKRLPVRFNYDDNYFFHAHQGMPKDGYTPIVANILDHPGITVHLSTPFDPTTSRGEYDHVIWSGPLDAWFGYRDGRLGYRTLDFERFTEEGDVQGTSVMNYGDEAVPFTRITEHKYFAPWESHDHTVCFREFSRSAEPDDIPYYPVRMTEDQELLERYLAKAKAEVGVSFVGRLGTYRYLDMDVTIGEALKAADEMKAAIAAGTAIPPFFIDPAVGH
jgi:UDP-galactopyranose mutase